MTSLTEQPKNINLLADIQFKFEISDLPNTSFFVQTVNVPGINLTEQDIPRPQHLGFSRFTGVVEYEPLNITFLIDEYLKNWIEIHDWITGNVEKYATGVLTILSSQMNPTIEFHFSGLFPTNISEISFDSTASEPTYQIATVAFRYSKYTIKNLINT